MIRNKPVGCPEHGEEKSHVRLVLDSLPQPHEFRLPAGVLHQDNATTIRSDHIFGVAEAESENCSKEHENDESNVGSVRDSAVGLDIDVLAKGNLVEC